MSSHHSNLPHRPPPPAIYRAIQVVEAPIANLAGMSCRDFARLTVTRMDRPLTSTETLRHRFHGAMCGLCGKFAAQFESLSELTRTLETDIPPPSPDEAAAARIAAAVRGKVK